MRFAVLGAGIIGSTIGRRWQEAAWDKVIPLLADLDLKNPQTDATLIAFKAIALAKSPKPADAKPAAEGSPKVEKHASRSAAKPAKRK